MTEIIVPDINELTLSQLDVDIPSQVNRSKWTGGRKVIGLAGAELWFGNAAIDDLATEEEERPWRVFLFGLKGSQNWFRWPLPCANHIGPKPTVAAGASDGYTMPLTGMQPSATILKAGQYMTVPLPSGHNRAIMLMANLVADASGNATATFIPALGEVPAEDAVVETVRPFIPMSLVEPRQGFALTDGVSGAAFAVEEAR